MTSMASRTEYSTQTPKNSTLFSGQYLHNHSTSDIGVLGYIGIVWPKEHSPEVWHIPPGTPCIYLKYSERSFSPRSWHPSVSVAQARFMNTHSQYLCSCQIIHPGIWQSSTQQLNPQAPLLVPLHWKDVSNLAAKAEIAKKRPVPPKQNTAKPPLHQQDRNRWPPIHPVRWRTSKTRWLICT
jgi:hypothetical protein